MANGHGGARANSGPKKGSSIRRSQQAVAKAEELGVDPVEMLLSLTKWAFEQFNAKDEKGEFVGRTKENADMVKDYAKEAAPYVRPKLAAIEASGPDGGPIEVEAIRREIVDPQHQDR